MKVTDELLEVLELKLIGNKYVIEKNGYYVYKTKLPEDAKESRNLLFCGFKIF